MLRGRPGERREVVATSEKGDDDEVPASREKPLLLPIRPPYMLPMGAVSLFPEG